jgi:Heavy-metal resistance
VILPLQAKYSVFQAAIALVVGLVLGFGGAALAYRYGLLPIPGERPFQRMARVLELTPTQREQLRDIMHDTRGKIDAARRGFEQQRHAIFFSAYVRIHALLTPSQQRIFDARFVPPSIRAEARAKLPASATPAPSVSTPVP